MSRLVYALLTGIVGACIVHITILMLIPRYAQHDVWTQLGDMGADGRFVRIEPAREGQAGTLIKTADPLFAIAACRFDLTGGLTHITAPGTIPFWSISIFDRKGENIYSFNDRNATDGRLDLTVASPVQMVELRKDLPAEFERSIFVETDVVDAVVVLRTFIPDRSWEQIVSEFIAGAACDKG